MRRSSLPLLATLVAACAVALAARSPGYQPAFASGFAVAAAWRLLVGRDGRQLLARRVVALLLGALLAAALPFLFGRAQEADGGGFFVAVLGTLTCFLGVALLAPLGALSAFWIVLLSSTSVAITCSLGADLLGVALVPAFVALLAVTLVTLERATAATRTAGLPHVRLVDPTVDVGRALRAASVRLVGLGVGLGLLLWLVAPRPGAPSAPPLPSVSPESERAAASEAAGGGQGPAAEAVTGPDAGQHDAVLGAVERIQQDNRVHLVVRRLAGAEQPTLILREATRDLWLDQADSVAARWRSSLAAQASRLMPDLDGWVRLHEPAAGRAERTLEIHARLGSRLLFLEAEALAFRIERPLDPLSEGLAGPRSVLLGETVARGSGRLERLLLPNDVLIGRGQPPPHDSALLEGRESSSRVSPLRSFADIEPQLAAALRERVRGVSGVAAGDTWRRATALERWLQGPEFDYALSSPRLAAGRRALDFLTRVRRGNCEWYATALTLLLRAQGFAARYVQGYWEGSHTPGSDLWTFYGTHYHAWTELYLDGVGWVPLNPTPPERRVQGTDSRTTEAGRQTGHPDADGTGSASWVTRARAALAHAWSETGSALGGSEPARLGLLLLGGGLLLWLWRPWRRGRARAGGFGGRARAPARHPYLEALRLLARRGKHRRQAQTTREFLAREAAGLPAEAGEPLERLTRAHEQQRYAGVADDADGARRDLRRLSRALRRS